MRWMQTRCWALQKPHDPTARPRTASEVEVLLRAKSPNHGDRAAGVGGCSYRPTANKMIRGSRKFTQGRAGH
jgi:hypothetical protein